ncbi:hypothetical protein, partial [Gellertiella hungarica]|uniref:hypothetical protein n=1 Tax=Gellertiella hungarica TaxID=1572859 RepID=UPI001AED47C6
MTDAAAENYDFSPPAPTPQRKLKIAANNSSWTVWSHSTQSLNSSQALRMLDVGGPRHFIAYCSVVRFLRQNLRVLSQRSFIVLATVPPCVDGPWNARLCIDGIGQVQSCVRPFIVAL